MKNYSFSELPLANEILESPYDLDEIRSRISGIFENKEVLKHLISSNNGESFLVLLKLILTLANEINNLKNKNILKDEDKFIEYFINNYNKEQLK